MWTLHTCPKATRLNYGGSGIRWRLLSCLRTLWIRGVRQGKAVKNTEHCCSLCGTSAAVLPYPKANQIKTSERQYKPCCTVLNYRCQNKIQPKQHKNLGSKNNTCISHCISDYFIWALQKLIRIWRNGENFLQFYISKPLLHSRSTHGKQAELF